ncbi:hypothetical protein [Bradyrhizobium sp. ORS 86]|uniref:hypothetical protein n=1 Tax=Bradyrhizobium sp. ORS 86 TaxID=1685970 RepID=UPI003890F757
MSALLNVTIAAASANQLSQVLQLRPGPGGNRSPTTVLLQGSLTYGSGGTTVDAWVQTSVDGGNSWVDVANFHFTTSSAKALFNLSSATPLTTQYAPTDGSLAANTSKDGIIGHLWRVKYTSVGTYAGNTTLRVDMIADGVTAQS